MDKQRIMEYLGQISPQEAKAYGAEVGFELMKECGNIARAAKDHPEEACAVLLSIQGMHEALKKFHAAMGDEGDGLVDRAEAIVGFMRLMLLPLE